MAADLVICYSQSEATVSIRSGEQSVRDKANPATR
jgi:hypothetical protein